MADNYKARGSDAVENTFAADDVGGVLHVRTKLEVGADGAAADLELGQSTKSASLPVTLASDQDALTVDGAATGATLYAVTLTNANQEYSQALPNPTRAVSVKARSAVAIRYAWATGKVATPTDPYQSLPANTEYSADNMKLTSPTIYLASATAGTVVEIEAWG